MPNWCDNELTIRSKRGGVLACLEAIRGDEECEREKPPLIDFDRIIPMPEILKGTTSPPDLRGLFPLGDEEAGKKILEWEWVREKGITTLEDLRCYLEQLPDYEELLAKARKTQQAEAMTGYSDWYSWCVANWGTKWNAQDTVFKKDPTDQEATICFDTAWSPPIPVVETLSRKFPRLSFTLRYWECGVGFKGLFRVHNGTVIANATFSYHGSRGG